MPPSIQPQERSTAPSKIINFDNYITKVRKIYDKYSSSSGGMEYKKSGSAIKEIEAIIDTIKGQVPHVSFARKQDALNAIVDISLEMLESTRSTLAHEIRKSYYFPRLGDTIERIIDGLSRQEIAILQGDGALFNELYSCNETAEEYALDMCLDGAIEKLTNGLSDEEDREDSEHDGAQGHDYGGSSLHSLVENEKTTAAKPQVGSWLESLEPTAAPLMVAAAV